MWQAHQCLQIPQCAMGWRWILLQQKSGGGEDEVGKMLI